MGRGFLTRLPKRLGNSRENGRPLGVKERLGPYRPQLLPRTNPRVTTVVLMPLLVVTAPSGGTRGCGGGTGRPGARPPARPRAACRGGLRSEGGSADSGLDLGRPGPATAGSKRPLVPVSAPGPAHSPFLGFLGPPATALRCPVTAQVTARRTLRQGTAAPHGRGRAASRAAGASRTSGLDRRPAPLPRRRPDWTVRKAPLFRAGGTAARAFRAGAKGRRELVLRWTFALIYKAARPFVEPWLFVTGADA